MERISREEIDMKPYHDVKDISVQDGKLSLKINGVLCTYNLEDVSDLLTRASDEEIANFEVSPAGYGIHWPLIDEDISIDGLLGVLHSPDSERKRA